MIIIKHSIIFNFYIKKSDYNITTRFSILYNLFTLYLIYMNILLYNSNSYSLDSLISYDYLNGIYFYNFFLFLFVFSGIYYSIFCHKSEFITSVPKKLGILGKHYMVVYY